MDLNDVWQENKRFILTVAGGALVFLIGEMLVGSFFGEELKAKRRSVSTSNRKLNESLYRAEDLQRARAENDELKGTIATLIDGVSFDTRPAFRVDSRKGSASSQYFSTVATTREALLTLAGRNSLRIPDSVGLPALSPTKDEDIARYLEALDLVDRVIRLCVDRGVERIDRIEIKLDPAIHSRHGVGYLEKTRVEFAISGAPQPIQEMLLATQASDSGPQLMVHDVELLPSKRKTDESRLEVTFAIPRLHGVVERFEIEAADTEPSS